ncbi:integrase arm-type DNA-binding domain-containing protein [Kosakonia sp. S42]|uniref:tyrosine-type recombinase/integrase n=1 Tax=Kosakonia sp. S42 TaxID=2767458 RepID=UPI00190A9313|nr:integrase arm-type DNA-binding domain-containing protein [Kosakonia sp. S42]
MALTDAVVRQTRTTDKDYTLNDADGLVLFITARGARKWHFRFTWAGRPQRVAIGNYPELSLKEAREHRDDLRAQIARGIDPRVYRLQCKAAALAAPLNTFETVFSAWRDFKALGLKSGCQSTLSQIDRFFVRDVLRWLGTLPIFDIDNPHLLDVLRRIERGVHDRREGATWLNQMFRYAMVEKGLCYNPASDLDIVAAPKPPVSHNPFLRMEELPAFLTKLGNYNGDETTRLGLRLLLLAGVRTGELRLAVSEQFDMKRGLWMIPPVIVK